MAIDRNTVRTARAALELHSLMEGITRPARSMCRPLSNSDIAVLDGYVKRLGEALAALGSAVIDACPPDELAAYAEYRVREQKQAEDGARMEADAAKRGCAS